MLVCSLFLVCHRTVLASDSGLVESDPEDLSSNIYRSKRDLSNSTLVLRPTATSNRNATTVVAARATEKTIKAEAETKLDRWTRAAGSRPSGSMGDSANLVAEPSDDEDLMTAAGHKKYILVKKKPKHKKIKMEVYKPKMKYKKIKMKVPVKKMKKKKVKGYLVKKEKHGYGA